MNNAEARSILIAHRNGREAGEGRELAEALELMRHDPALGEWWRQQQEFHGAMVRGFAQVPVPAGLREQIAARVKVIPFPWWRRPVVWAAAAALIFLLGLAGLFWKPAAEGSFTTFRARMVRAVLRQYRMDIQTNDMAGIRQFLSTHRAPADYTLPRSLDKLPPVGAGVLSWQAGRVSMVCLDSGADGTLFLFIADRSEVRQPPGVRREFAQVNKLVTVSWTEDGKVYVLAAHGARAVVEKFFP